MNIKWIHDYNLITTECIFNMKVTSIIIFVSATMAILYYYGIAQYLIIKVSWLLCFIMGTSPSESFAAAANIFLSMVIIFDLS